MKRQMTRRVFLRNATAGGAGLTILSHSRSAFSYAANEKLNVAAIGCGDITNVMIATKGLTKYAAGNRAEIVRRDSDGKQVSIRVRLNDLIKDGDISQNIDMQPGDTLIIPQSWF